MRRSLLVTVTTLVLATAPAWAAVQSSKTSNATSATPTSSSTTSSMHQHMGTTAHMKTHRISGTVESVTSDQLSIKTASGKEDAFALQPTTNKAADIAVGNRVTVWYNEQNGAKDATRVVVAKSSIMSHKGSTSGAKTGGAATTKSGSSFQPSATTKNATKK